MVWQSSTSGVMDLTFLKLIEFLVLAANSISDNKNNLFVKDFVLELSHISVSQAFMISSSLFS